MSGTGYDGFPHDYGEHCCCVTCSGPEGDECTPDRWTGACVRCNRPAVIDDPDTTAEILEGIAARINATAQGQTSWL